MATVSKQIADAVVKGNGYAFGDAGPDNPRCLKIVEYESAWGEVSYGLIFEGEHPNRYSETEYVRHPRLYWRFKDADSP
jgi:hypothetical protein